MKRTERVTKRANLAGWALTALSLLCGGIQALAKENAQTGRRCQPAAAHLSLGLPQLRCIWKMSPWLSSPNQNFRSKNRTNRGAFLTTRRYFAGPVILVAANAMKCSAIIIVQNGHHPNPRARPHARRRHRLRRNGVGNLLFRQHLQNGISNWHYLCVSLPVM